MAETNVVEVNYLEQIAALKTQMDQMVSGDKYDELVKEHKRLTDDFINKREPAKVTDEELKPASEYAKILMTNKKTSNLEFVRNSLNYRKAFIKEFGRDPWANELQEGGSTVEDAQAVADHMTSLMSEFGDDPAEFNFRFEQSLVDDPLLVAKLKNRKK